MNDKKKWISDELSWTLSILTIFFSSLGFLLEALLVFYLRSDAKIPFDLMNLGLTWSYIELLFAWWGIGLFFCIVFCIIGLFGTLFEKEKEQFYFYGGILSCIGIILALCVSLMTNFA